MITLAGRLRAAIVWLSFFLVNSPLAVMSKDSDGAGDYTVARGTVILDAAAPSSVDTLKVHKRATAVIDFSNAAETVRAPSNAVIDATNAGGTGGAITGCCAFGVRLRGHARSHHV